MGDTLDGNSRRGPRLPKKETGVGNAPREPKPVTLKKPQPQLKTTPLLPLPTKTNSPTEEQRPKLKSWSSSSKPQLTTATPPQTRTPLPSTQPLLTTEGSKGVASVTLESPPRKLLPETKAFSQSPSTKPVLTNANFPTNSTAIAPLKTIPTPTPTPFPQNANFPEPEHQNWLERLPESVGFLTFSEL